MSKFKVGERVIYWPLYTVNEEFEKRRGEEIVLAKHLGQDRWEVRFTPRVKSYSALVTLTEARFRQIEEVDEP